MSRYYRCPYCAERVTLEGVHARRYTLNLPTPEQLTPFFIAWACLVVVLMFALILVAAIRGN